MWVSSVDPMTMTREGNMAHRMFMGMPAQAIIPKVQVRLKAEVMRGINAAKKLRRKKRMARASTKADRGASSLRSSKRTFLSSALMRGGPT